MSRQAIYKKLTSTIGVAKVVVAKRIEAKISDKTAIVII